MVVQTNSPMNSPTDLELLVQDAYVPVSTNLSDEVYFSLS